MTGQRTGLLRVAIGGAVLVVVGLACFLVLRGPVVPAEAEGRAWLAEFADRLTASRTWGARGPAALALFPGLGPWPTGECVLAWSNRDTSAPVVTYQRLELGRLNTDEPCAQAQFGMLSTTLRQSDGITPGALAERFTERFGPPAMERDASLHGTLTSTWQMQDGIFAIMQERLQPGGEDTFSVLFVRSYAAPASLADAAESERWMERTVSLMTGPDLPDARGSAAAALLDADMEAHRGGDLTCPTTFVANLLARKPIASGQMLLLEQPEGTPCDQARFSSLSMRIWQHDPVTAAALAGRLNARLGAPALSRDFERNTVQYQWTTAHGTTIELVEDLSDTGRHWLTLRTWRS